MNSIDVENLAHNAHIFRCPSCELNFSVITSDAVSCAQGHKFQVDNGLPMLFAPHSEYVSSNDVTDSIREFYMENPFPDYEDMDTLGSLIDRSRRSVFARNLDKALPLGTRILEVGCGTGQMSIFLSMANRQVYGVDLCPNSLRMGRSFRDKHDLKQVCFYQMNLFRPIFREKSFDLVYCSGVLHHTAFPRKGFESLCGLVKPNGYIIIGLYNKYLRIPTHIRRWLSKAFAIDSCDPILRHLGTRKKRETWFKDQYRNPHESTHSIEEVAEWFEDNGFQIVNSIPSGHLGQNRDSVMNPFQEVGLGKRYEVVLNQILSIPAFGKEGGLFLVVGKRLV